MIAAGQFFVISMAVIYGVLMVAALTALFVAAVREFVRRRSAKDLPDAPSIKPGDPLSP